MHVKLKLLLGLLMTLTTSSSLNAANIWSAATLKGVYEMAIHAPSTDYEYRIQVAPLGEAPPSGYPTLYLLDGDAMMPLALSMTQGMMRGPNAKRSGVLLVAIGYPNANPLDLAARARDYTPPPLSTDGKHGGAAIFHDFLSHTLRPAIAKDYPIDMSKQAIYGHSFGGLYVLYQLFHHPEEFQYYFSSSPSIWWDETRILQAEHLLKKAPQLLRLSVGELEQPNETITVNASAQAQKQVARQMVGNVEALEQSLQSRFPNALINAVKYADETHGSVIHRALYDNINMWMQRVSTAKQ